MRHSPDEGSRWPWRMVVLRWRIVDVGGSKNGVTAIVAQHAKWRGVHSMLSQGRSMLGAQAAEVAVDQGGRGGWI
jgi:hypothetical protein